MATSQISPPVPLARGSRLFWLVSGAALVLALFVVYWVFVRTPPVDELMKSARKNFEDAEAALKQTPPDENRAGELCAQAERQLALVEKQDPSNSQAWLLRARNAFLLFRVLYEQETKKGGDGDIEPAEIVDKAADAYLAKALEDKQNYEAHAYALDLQFKSRTDLLRARATKTLAEAVVEGEKKQAAYDHHEEYELGAHYVLALQAVDAADGASAEQHIEKARALADAIGKARSAEWPDQWWRLNWLEAQVLKMKAGDKILPQSECAQARDKLKQLLAEARRRAQVQGRDDAQLAVLARAASATHVQGLLGLLVLAIDEVQDGPEFLAAESFFVSICEKFLDASPRHAMEIHFQAKALEPIRDRIAAQDKALARDPQWQKLQQRIKAL